MTRATTFRATAIVGGVLLAILMIMTVSRAAFSDVTSNDGNTWSSGTVVLTDDHQPDNIMFEVEDLVPDMSGKDCIGVIYEGTVDANVVLSSVSTAGSTGLAPALHLEITRHASSTCTDASPTPVYTGSMSGAGGFTGGWLAAPWDGSAGTQDTEFYKVEWSFPIAADNNNYQGKGARAAFTWQATSN